MKREPKIAHVVLIDETGLQLSPLRRRSWAKRGCRPILRQLAGAQRVSVIAALTLSPKTLRRNLFFQTLIDGTFDSTRIAAFLRDLLEHLRGKIIVVWDNGPMHKGPAIRTLLKRNPRLTVEHLPPYAPELNPVEALWSHLK
ncbi:MAG: IS630 family transposase [Gemmataceae bacterium]